MPAATIVHSHRRDGDFRVDGAGTALDARRSRLVPGSWTWLHQVHGAEVVVVEHPGQHAGAAADAAVTVVPGAVLAVHTADCVPVLLHDPANGVVGAAHAGWRGLVAGVVEAAVGAMVDLGAGAGSVAAHVGPHIRGRCYEFGEAELDRVAARYGEAVRTTTAAGTPALDLTVAVRAALDALEAVGPVEVRPGCTACDPAAFYSHRARGEQGRHAGAIALEGHPDG